MVVDYVGGVVVFFGAGEGVDRFPFCRVGGEAVDDFSAENALGVC